MFAHVCVTHKRLALFSFGRFDNLGNTSHIVSLFKQTSEVTDHELPTSLCVGMCENKIGEGSGGRRRKKRRRGGRREKDEEQCKEGKREKVY